jgi:hypothetical protein
VNRGILQAVAERLITQRDLAGSGKQKISRRIPIENQAIFIHVTPNCMTTDFATTDFVLWVGPLGPT